MLSHSGTLYRREFWRACLLITVLVLLTHGRGLVSGRLAAGADAIRAGYPLRHHFWTIVARGELPTWSPMLLGGYPIIVEEHAQPFYPPEWLFGLFRSPMVFNALFIFHFWLAGVGAYLLARLLNIRPIGAWATTLAILFGAPLPARVAAGHNGHLYSYALMIWALAATFYLAKRHGWWSALGLGGIVGLQLLIGVGAYHILLYTILLLVPFSGYLFLFEMEPEQRRPFIMWGIVAAILALGIGAARFIVTVDVGLQGNRQQGLSEESINYGSLPMLMLSGYLLPHTFDDPSISDYIWPEFAVYMGTAPILLALYAVRKQWRNLMVRWWAGIVFFFLWLSLGNAGGLFRYFTKVVPVYTLLRNPARHSMVAGLGIAILAGYGLDALMSLDSKPISMRREKLLRLGIVVAVLVCVTAASYHEPSATQSFDVLPQRFLRGLIWFTAALVSFRWAVRLYQFRPRPLYAVLILAVIATDLICYAEPLIYQGIAPSSLSYISPTNFPGDDAPAVAFYETGDSTDWGKVNAAVDSGVRLINGYSGVIPQRMVAAVNVMTGRPASQNLEENLLTVDSIAKPSLLDLMGARWLILNADEPLPNDPSLQNARSLRKVYYVENIDAYPFAFVIPTIETVSSAEASRQWLERTDLPFGEHAVVEGRLPANEETCPVYEGETTEHISTIRLEGGNLWFDLESPQSGMLIINQTYQRGWQGWVDGEKAHVYPVDHRWIGVYLACPGTYNIHVRYFPDSLRAGLVISGITLFAALFVSVWRWFSAR